MSLILNFQKNKTTSDVIVGTYSRLMKLGTRTYQVELSFTDDKHLIWVPSEQIPMDDSPNLKYQLLGDIIRIYETRLYNREAFYHYHRFDNMLNLSSLSDSFSSRWITLNGVWKIKQKKDS